MARRRLLHLESGDAHARPRHPLGCGGAWRQMGEVKDGSAASDRRVGHLMPAPEDTARSVAPESPSCRC